MRVVAPQELARRAAWVKACETCKNPFGWSKNGDAARYCSRKCAGAAVGKINAGQRLMLRSYVCFHCKVPFRTYYDNRKFCSQQCVWDAIKDGTYVKRGGKTDGNHREIVNALRDHGACIIDTSGHGGGFPDLIVGFNGMTFLVEIKNLKTQYGRAGLNKNQQKWKARWTGGPYCIVTDIESAIRAISVSNPDPVVTVNDVEGALRALKVLE